MNVYSALGQQDADKARGIQENRMANAYLLSKGLNPNDERLNAMPAVQGR
jgi:hypothetical protein